LLHFLMAVAKHNWSGPLYLMVGKLLLVLIWQALSIKILPFLNQL